MTGIATWPQGGRYLHEAGWPQGTHALHQQGMEVGPCLPTGAGSHGHLVCECFRPVLPKPGCTLKPLREL